MALALAIIMSLIFSLIELRAVRDEWSILGATTVTMYQFCVKNQMRLSVNWDAKRVNTFEEFESILPFRERSHNL